MLSLQTPYLREDYLPKTTTQAWSILRLHRTKMASMESQPGFDPDHSESTSASASPSPDLDVSSPIPEGVRPLSLKRLHMSEPSDSLRFETVRKPAPGTSIDTLLAEHERYTKAWKASDAYRELYEFFTDVLLNINTFQITSCMCLCLGSMTAQWPNVEWLYRGGRDHPCVRSLSQLVAFESWIELLSEYISREIIKQGLTGAAISRIETPYRAAIHAGPGIQRPRH